jgi:hypothetical protein
MDRRVLTQCVFLLQILEHGWLTERKGYLEVGSERVKAEADSQSRCREEPRKVQDAVGPRVRG